MTDDNIELKAANAEIARLNAVLQKVVQILDGEKLDGPAPKGFETYYKARNDLLSVITKSIHHFIGDKTLEDARFSEELRSAIWKDGYNTAQDEYESAETIRAENEKLREAINVIYKKASDALSY